MNDIPNAVRSASRATHLVDVLPAIPTQNWVNQCAQAIATISDRAIVLSLVTTISHENDRTEVISSGVAIGGSHNGQDPRAIALQDKSERLTRLGFTLPEHARSRGIVAPLQSLSPSWSSTPIGRALTSVQATNPLIHAVPIFGNGSGLWLLNLVGYEPDTDLAEARLGLQLLNALHQPLSIRASDALVHVTNPRAWLTDREQGVLDLLIQGHSVRVIAEQLGRSAHTVHDHVKNLHKKIGASSRGELIAKALGHKHQSAQGKIADPLLMLFPGDQIAELKPGPIMARPLRG